MFAELNLAEMKINPSFSVISGPMFSGKSQEIDRRLTNIDYYNRYQERQGNLAAILNYIILRPEVDNRDDKIRDLPYKNKLWKYSRTNSLLPLGTAISYELNNYDLIILDEAQFYSKEIIQDVRNLLIRKKSIIVSGLDKDFRGNPFSEFMSWALCSCDEVTKLHAVCSICGRPSTMAKLITVDGTPIPEGNNLVIEDENHIYVPTCRQHFN